MGNEVSSASKNPGQTKAEGKVGKKKGGKPNLDLVKKNDSNNTASTSELSANINNNSSPLRNADRAASNKLSARTSRVISMKQEDSIPVNLPMTELMAYLQVVANNSSNLPLTRRDDPELGRTVSSLISDEYEAKSSAFIPSDFKFIGGSFTKYGKVWDLPTSEEYTPVDGAQEPGVSYGGACTNSFLKAMYDTENDNDIADKSSKNLAIHSRSEDSYLPVDSKSLPSLDMGELTMPSSMSWAELLQKMKLEMFKTGFCQEPQITSSTRLDLSKPVSLVPESFDPSHNKKRSLLIGCNFSEYGKGAELKASHDDVNSMKDYIVNIHGFPQSKEYMTILLDDGINRPPTYKNITDAFKNLSENSMSGDVVFVHYVGHGCRVLDSPVDPEVDSYDEGIVPNDFGNSGIIRDTLIFKTLIAPMRKGVTVTCVFDACDTGVMVDLPFSWRPSENKQESPIMASVNTDFSFVRFLKVIKTLYESSTFTQLGKTVHCVLDEKSPTSARYDDYSIESNSFDDASLVTLDKENTRPAASAFFRVLSACNGSKPVSNTPKLTMNMTDISDVGSPVNSRRQENGSMGGIFQHMLNCTIPLLDDVDDDHRQMHRQRQSNDNTTVGDVSSYGTELYSDDEGSILGSPGRSSKITR